MKLLVIDDHPIVLSGCRSLFEAAGYSVLAVDTAQQAEETFLTANPDVSIIDINLQDISGFELTRRLIAMRPDAKIIIFSMNDDRVYCQQAIQCGARGYFSKNDDPAALRRAVEVVAAGGISLPADMAQQIAFDRLNPSGQQSNLSSREIEILRLLVRGKSMSEIADMIDISYKTVASDCVAIRAKLNARTPLEMVRIAIEQKLL